MTQPRAFRYDRAPPRRTLRDRLLGWCEAVLGVGGLCLVVATSVYWLHARSEEQSARAAFERTLQRAPESPPAVQAAPAVASRAPRTAPAAGETAVPSAAAPAMARDAAQPAPLELDAPPQMDAWSAARAAAYDEVRAAPVEPVGVLAVPSLELEVLVLEGTAEPTLARGVGLIEGTARPGGAGNVGVAGHRDGFFRSLRHIELGARISVRTRTGTYDYVVESTRVVAPHDVHVLASGDRPALTLVTCYPFYFVGPAPQRFIVSATQVARASTPDGT